MESCRFLQLRRLGLIVLAALATAVAAAQAPAQGADSVKAVDLTGPWQWEQGKESLDLTLEQHGTVITGYHSAVGQRGAKVDEVTADSGQPSITGEINGNVATVKFRSGYPDSTGGGTARLTLRGSFLYWEITKTQGEHYLPRTARLTRVKARAKPQP
jgi:hypothetical protein